MNFFDNQQPQQMVSLLLEKEERTDRHGNKFLVLTLENKRKVWVFPSNISEDRWWDLQIGQVYNLTVKENKPLPSYETGLLQLLDFSEGKIEL